MALTLAQGRKPHKYYLHNRCSCLDCGAAVRQATRCKPCEAKRRIKHWCVCLACGKTYHNKRRNPVEGAKYCSRACAFGVMREKVVPKYCRVYEHQCLFCNKNWIGRRPDRKCCSQVCLKKYLSDRHRIKTRRSVLQSRPTSYECPQCGVAFTPVRHLKRMRFCSVRCCRRAAQQRHKARRRAQQHGVLFQPVLAREIANRDGWHCKWCAIETPARKRGSCDLDAPEIDHVIPLSCGGPHIRSNLQLLCRSCNQAKGSQVFD